MDAMTNDVELPNGNIIRNVPLGISKTEVMRKAVNAGLATYADFGEKLDPTADMSFGDKLLAGAGKAFMDIYRGTRQLMASDQPTLSSLIAPQRSALQQEIDEAARLDKPLMNTKAGMVGNALGNVAAAAPLAFVPGANTVAGSAALGGLTSALQPVETGGSRASNAIVGTALGGAGQVLGNVAPSALRALAAPFTESGRQRIVADTLRRFSPNIGQRLAAGMPQPKIPGVQFNLAQATQDPGIAVLTRSAGAAEPQTAAALAARDMANREAAQSALRGIAGDDAARAAAENAREAAVGQLYRRARNEVVPVDDEFMSLMDRPAIQEAYQRAASNSTNSGRALPPLFEETGGIRVLGDVTGDTLHQMKVALDDAATGAPGSAFQNSTLRGVRDARNDLLGWLEANIPDYKTARETYASMSQPINQMEIGQALHDVLVPALSDTPGVGLFRTRADQFATALRNSERTAQSATGRANATIEDVLTPQQFQDVQGVRDFLARRAAADDLARGPGSNTAQNMAGASVVRSVADSLIPGLSRLADSSFGQSLLNRPLGMLYKGGAEPRIQQALAEALLSPQAAQDALRGATPGQLRQLAAALYRRALPSFSGSLGADAASQ